MSSQLIVAASLTPEPTLSFTAEVGRGRDCHARDAQAVRRLMAAQSRRQEGCLVQRIHATGSRNAR